MSDIATLTRSLEAERIARAEVERLLDERTRQLDISTRQLYETAEAYKDQIRRTHAIVDSAAEAIVIFDSHGTIDSFNPAAEVIFGCTAEEARERNITSFLPDVPFCNVELDGQVEILCDNGAGEIMGRKADGQNIPLELVIGSFEHDSNLFYTALMRIARAVCNWKLNCPMRRRWSRSDSWRQASRMKSIRPYSMWATIRVS